MKKQFIVAVALAGIALIASQVQASEPLELQKVMQELGKNMQTITDGISREDWGLVVKTAPMVAEHPQPPLAEKMRIMALYGL